MVFILAILVGLQWYHIVVFTCISLMIYVGHLFISLYGISISSSVKYLFNSPAFFPQLICFLLSFELYFIFWIQFFFFLPDIPSCKDFPTGLWIAFSFFNSLLQNKSFAILLKSNLSLFNLYHVLGVIIMISLPNPVRKIFCFFPQSL